MLGRRCVGQLCFVYELYVTYTNRLYQSCVQEIALLKAMRDGFRLPSDSSSLDGAPLLRVDETPPKTEAEMIQDIQEQVCMYLIIEVALLGIAHGIGHPTGPGGGARQKKNLVPP